MSKIDELKLKSSQCDALAIVAEFRNALQKHFQVVEFNARKLINERWGDKS
jgi:hypothetical protein